MGQHYPLRPRPRRRCGIKCEKTAVNRHPADQEATKHKCFLPGRSCRFIQNKEHPACCSLGRRGTFIGVLRRSLRAHDVQHGLVKDEDVRLGTVRDRRHGGQGHGLVQGDADRKKRGRFAVSTCDWLLPSASVSVILLPEAVPTVVLGVGRELSAFGMWAMLLFSLPPLPSPALLISTICCC